MDMSRLPTLMKVFLVLFIVFLFVIANSGCSVFMAARQPSKKDVDLFKVGTPRGSLLAEFGEPAVNEVRDGKKFEEYRFINGYGTGAKAVRAVWHGACDVCSWGLWEIVGTPMEVFFNGDAMVYEVRYDENDRIDQVNLLKKK
jgi:hypothetical protein